MIEDVHARFVHGRRVRTLVAHVAPLIPAGARVLDVGAGDGHIAAALMAARPDLDVRGIDPLVRPDALIPVQAFDGATIPFADSSFDAVLFIDVLHHTADPLHLLREGKRVARQFLVVKDHLCDGFLAARTLRFMDVVGNRRHGVALPYHYLSTTEWDRAFRAAGLRRDFETRRLALYPWPASWLFDRSLHFVARLRAT
jgi:SAM-dependent methyltransferase